jgi:hypothetical protein
MSEKMILYGMTLIALLLLTAMLLGYNLAWLPDLLLRFIQ